MGKQVGVCSAPAAEKRSGTLSSPGVENTRRFPKMDGLRLSHDLPEKSRLERLSLLESKSP
jgi:hypothetical protein